MSDISISDCTVLIFTYEREQFLYRTMTYWSACEVKVVIADGSKEPSLNIPDNIEYLHRPGATITDRIIELTSKVATKYAVFVADDDFIGYEALQRSVEFLKMHSDYSSVQGLYTKFWTLRPFKKVIHQPNDYDYAKAYHWHSEDYASRLISINDSKIMHYCYSVVTKPTLESLARLLSGLDVSLGNTLFEPLMAYAVSITGKVKTQNYFYCARQVQEQDWKGIIYFEDFIKNKPLEYNKFLKNVVNECIVQHDEDEKKAKEIAIAAGKTYSKSIEDTKNYSIQEQKIFINQLIAFVSGMYLKIKGYTKLYMQLAGIMKITNVESEFFSNNKDALQSFNRDWMEIEKVIKKVKVSNIKY